MRVLILSYHIPPDPAVGTLRVARLADALRRAGHQVELIGPHLPSGTGHHETGVHRVARWRNPRELALALRNTLRLRRKARGPAGSSGGHTGWVIRDDVPAWKRFLVAMALMPDDHQGFILPAAARAIRLIRGSGVDLLYTSGPPHSAHVAGLLAKLFTRVRWAAEFRDPWTDNAVQPRYARSDTAAAMKRWLERVTLRRADHVIAVSEAAGRLFAAKMPGSEGRVIVARNGIDVPAAVVEPRQTSEPVDSGPMRVVYIGNLYHGRDPRPFLEAVASLIASGEAPAEQVRVDFFGDCRIYRGADVQRIAEDLGLQRVVRLHGYVPQAEAVRRARTADLLLLLAQDQPLQIPNKLYEYLGTGRPILAFADEEGETAEMLRLVGGHFVVSSDDPRTIRDVVGGALKARGWTPSPGTDRILSGWSARTQMDGLVQRLALGPRSSEGAETAADAHGRRRDSVLRTRHAERVGSE